LDISEIPLNDQLNYIFSNVNIPCVAMPTCGKNTSWVSES